MIFVEPADTSEEQNLACFQEKGAIYYAAIRDIPVNETLKVWYSPPYAKKMGKLVLPENSAQEFNEEVTDMNALLKSQQKILDKDSWTCKFCGVIKIEVTEFAIHIMEHYIAQLRKTCEICKATFISRKSLKKHMNIVHNNNSLTKTESPKIQSNQNIAKELSLGGPLLNNLEPIDNLDNSNLLVPSLNNLNEDFQNIGSENLNFENLLTDNVRALDHFNFEIGDCQEEFVCDICVKTFTKLHYLVQHLKRHTAENFCINCKKIFGRKENLLSHSCIGNPKFKCDQCDRSFYQKKYYKKHIDSVHNKKFKCDSCNYNYCNKYELNRHNCKAKLNEVQRYSCTICKKFYSHPSYVKKHMLRHHSSENQKLFICSSCPKQYMDKYSLKVHMKSHGEPELQCEVCYKKFFRKDVYEAHMEIHINQEMECDICNKKFYTSKSLYLHKKIHENNKFKCINCDAIFNSKSNLNKHSKTHLKSLITDNVSSYYSCLYCNKKMKLKSSLVRHINKMHPDSKNEPLLGSTEGKATTLPTETTNNNFINNNDVYLMTNSKDNIDLINDTDISELENDFHIEMIDNILLNTTKEMGINFSDDLISLTNLDVDQSIIEGDIFPADSIQNNEICLSMPDLTDQDITLGTNAYILDNGTIVEPQENSNNIVVYVLNETKD
ncbi:hypothetical protein WA026_006699 [Henosepilachna vigintioctopunctata]